MHNIIKTAVSKLKKEKVFTVSAVLALLSCTFARPSIQYMDFKVLFSLFNLMAVVAAMKKLKVMDYIAVRILNNCTHMRQVSLVLICLCFFSSMLLTNDVALITFVPLSVIISRRASFPIAETVVLQTLAANIGSSLTPMGNPQNLYLFSKYSFTTADFFMITLPFVAAGFIFIWLLNKRLPAEKVHIELNEVELGSKYDIIIFLVLFIAVVLSIFNLINYTAVFAAALCIILLRNKALLKDIDFFLLGTFVFFFIFIGNISTNPQVNTLLKDLFSSPRSTYIGSIGLSQIISNVPAAILISGFTCQCRQVLLGVNIGGMGTLIASLASVISYKIYSHEFGNQASGSYFKIFTKYNALGLLLFGLLFFFL